MFFDVRQLKGGRKTKITSTGNYVFTNRAVSARVHTLPPQPQIVIILTQMNTVIPKGVLGPRKLTHCLPSSEPNLFSLCAEYLPPINDIRVATLAFLASMAFIDVGNAKIVRKSSPMASLNIRTGSSSSREGY